MTLATGVGSMPGDDTDAFLRAVRVVLDELHELPFLPEVPGRGAIGGMTGRALAVVSGLGVDLQPAGWRLTDASGVDHRRARSLLAQDLDVLEEEAEGYSGSFKIQVAGPWTLAATVEKPRGDKVLSDHGARRELAQALAEGVRDHVADVRRRLPGVDRLVVQVDEPALAAVLAAKVPTASGFGRHRIVHPPEASEQLGWVLDAIAASGAEPWVHGCAPQTPLALLRGAGARGLCVDFAQLSAGDHDVLGEALETGEYVVLGVVPATGGTLPEETQVVESVLRWMDMLGIDPAVTGDRLVISPSCGLAGASDEQARQTLAVLASAARNLTD